MVIEKKLDLQVMPIDPPYRDFTSRVLLNLVPASSQAVPLLQKDRLKYVKITEIKLPSSFTLLYVLRAIRLFLFLEFMKKLIYEFTNFVLNM